MSHRLPRTILPRSYEIELQPDLEQATFSGSARVEAHVAESTDRLICNAIELDIHEVAIDGEPAQFELHPDVEQLEVVLPTPRDPGPVVFTASFDGILNDQLRGFYRSTYTDDGGNEQVIATSQLQATDARRAFPCWDEPDMKATYAVTLVVDPDLLAVSNGGEVGRTERSDGLLAVQFAETMPMSTYLVAFVVGPLTATEPRMAGSTPIRIIHRPGKEHLTEFALDVAEAALAYFEDYYGIPYPSDKLDMIALPDFAAGAMENLGCITYREVLLLVDPETATQPELQNVADVVNHEIAHMWFGDLVTMSWWNGIWLNEAFATFMEMKATDDFRPEWQRWTSFGISRSAAMDIDSLKATRPIEFPVDSPTDAEAMFDLLTYEKGAAIVRMLEQWLGEEIFRDGIRHYLDKHRFGNTETYDLWDALEHVSGRPVTDAMETWIFQGGYPVIEVGETAVGQTRFSYLGGEDGLWHVPVRARAESGSVELIELDSASAEWDVDIDSIESFNHRGHGFYRVDLPGSKLAAIGESGTGSLDAVERFGLVDDAWALTLAGRTELSQFLELLNAYRNEPDVSVWQRVLGALGFIHHVAADDSLPAYGELVGSLIGPKRDELGLEPADDEPVRTRQLRGALFSAAGNLTSDSGVLSDARAIHDRADADSEMAAAAVKVIAANGDRDDFAEFRRRFEDADNPQTETRYLYSLPLFEQRESIEELIDMSVSGAIRTQNAPYVLGQALMNRHHGPMVWEVIRDRYETLVDKFPSNTIVRMLTGVRWLTDRPVADDVMKFFSDRPLPQGQKQLDQHLERLGVNVEFQDRVRAELPEILGG